jgi:hypothetical protein
MSGTAKLRNGIARLYHFPKGVQHVAWTWVHENYLSYSSWTPEPGLGSRVGTRDVPMPGGGTSRLVISRRGTNRFVTLEEDVAHYGEPRHVDVTGLNLAEMTRLHRFKFLLGDHGVHGPLQAYVLASAQDERDGRMVDRFNCVIHCMTLFTAALTGIVLPPRFAERHAAALVNHWRSNAFPDVIQAREVFDVVQGFAAERG